MCKRNGCDRWKERCPLILLTCSFENLPHFRTYSFSQVSGKEVTKMSSGGLFWKAFLIFALLRRLGLCSHKVLLVNHNIFAQYIHVWVF